MCFMLIQILVRNLESTNPTILIQILSKQVTATFYRKYVMKDGSTLSSVIVSCIKI
jgi:hypothetical protein